MEDSELVEIKPKRDIKLTLAFIFSIVGILGASFFGIGLPFSCTSFILADLVKNEDKNIYRRLSIIFSVIGLVINIISFIIYLTMYLYHIAPFGAAEKTKF